MKNLLPRLSKHVHKFIKTSERISTPWPEFTIKMRERILKSWQQFY